MRFMHGIGVEGSWCALYTRYQHEKAVAERLEAKGFEVLLPLYRSVRRWKDREKVLQLPLFPNYVFVRGAATRRLAALETPGVHMILAVGDRVAIIPEAEIELILRMLKSDSPIEPHPFLRCGETVRILRGSLAGVEGILVRQKNNSRLVLSVDMLERSVSVEIDLANVEPVIPGKIVGAYSPADGVAARQMAGVYAR